MKIYVLITFDSIWSINSPARGGISYLIPSIFINEYVVDMFHNSLHLQLVFPSINRQPQLKARTGKVLWPPILVTEVICRNWIWGSG